jgi:hypothetical protein
MKTEGYGGNFVTKGLQSSWPTRCATGTFPVREVSGPRAPKSYSLNGDSSLVCPENLSSSRLEAVTRWQ